MIIFVVRHAGRRPDPEDDLTLEGLVRAELLARMLAEGGVGIAYHSDARGVPLTHWCSEGRTQQGQPVHSLRSRAEDCGSEFV
jgi:hypothetical protein